MPFFSLTPLPTILPYKKKIINIIKKEYCNKSKNIFFPVVHYLSYLKYNNNCKGNKSNNCINSTYNNSKNLLIKNRFFSCNSKESEKDLSSIKMTSTVPQVVSLDPVTLPIVYQTPIDSMKIEINELNNVLVNADEGLLVFLVKPGDHGSNNNSGPNSLITIKTKTNDPCVNEFLTAENIDNFNGKLGNSKLFCIKNSQKKYINIAYIGSICSNELSEFEIRTIVSSLVNLVHENKFNKMSIIFEIDLSANLFRFFLETFFYEYMIDERFKSLDKVMNVHNLKELFINISNGTELGKELEKARTYFFGTYYASQLIAAPSNYCNPISLSNVAVELAEKLNLNCKILGIKEIEELKMGSYLSVGKGSMYPHRFIHLSYKGKGEIKKKIALVGKGITFDSGGYNLKASPGSMIDLMKFDMSGCAAVLGCAYCIGTLKPENIEVHFLSAVCENMVSKNAYRPGDIITASNGKTIEVGNTDAEGRLTLADALVYAEKIGVDYIIDIATLTGAMLYSLGTASAGVFSNNDKLINKLYNSSKTSNEPIWQLPIIHEYRSSLNSKYADINNVSSSVKASSIVATLFLKEFVHSTPWAHIDIAGVAWNFKTRKPRGFGVRLLTEFVINNAI
ncbi:M17 leucyl aminopeptidase [Hepatocystis sp. ex Piliocolobus tephrosceles]|uniref:leucyl aminopeptidase n=1 Tax=Piliocolobus tephrosceles TaxID=591936 RepID=A0A8C9HZG7_9PRIM|nr:M17 leucyl aminopeptidase [Hepatocystis sp. ex Piliocolobus tephrosceles]